MTSHLKTLLLVAVAIAAASCSSNKQIAYLQDMQQGVNYPFETKKEIVLQPNDLIDIVVSCPKPELALPFNSRYRAIGINEQGGLTSVSDGTERGQQGYRIDALGNIQMPILGKIKAGGLTMQQLEEEVRRRIAEGDYIIAPQVSAELLNFKYTVLGAVAHAGSFNADGERVTLMEALANAGDLSIEGNRKRVSVIRETEGGRVRIDHDLRKKSSLQSPHFFLQPNDIVYVEPRYQKKDAEERRLQYTSLLLSFVTALCSAIWAFK